MLKSPPQWRLESEGGQAQLDPEGVSEIAAEGWTGRFERISFGAGFHMSLGRFDVSAPSEISVVRTDGGPMNISCYAVVRGEALFHLAEGPSIRLMPSVALLFRPSARGGRYELAAPQLLRIFSLVIEPERFRALLDGDLPPALAGLFDDTDETAFAYQTELGPLTRSAILKLGNPRQARPLERVMREAVALQFLNDLVEPLMGASADRGPSAEEAGAMQEALERLVANLRDPPPATLLADRLGMSQRRFLRAFEAVHGMSPAQALRLARLETAHRLLETDLTLKEVSWRVGYAHVSNFVTAFASHFGQPPRRFSGRR